MSILPVIKYRYLAYLCNSASFYFGWIACISAGATNRPYFGFFIAIALVIAHLIFISRKISLDLLLIVTAFLLGIIVDSSFIHFHIIFYATANPFFENMTPLWVLGVYMIFATSINYSLCWLKNRMVLGMLLGASGGFASYYAGIKTGAATFGKDALTSSVVISLTWATLLPIFYIINHLFEKILSKKNHSH